MNLQKASLAELDEKNEPQKELAVQFNPTSLRLQIANTIEGGENPGRQVRQYIGSSSTTLSLDLIFDTADEATTDRPRSVRQRTDMVERFLRPKGKEKKKFVTPRVRFRWNELVFDGVVDNVTIDFDHFAPNGAPLRAKVSLAIKEQNRDLELLATGAGANRAANAPAPGATGAASPGASGLGAAAGADNVGVALEGESASEFAARVGVDPAAWRGLALGGESSLSLSAGVEIGFDANLSVSAGLGVTVGVEAGASASVEASFGLEANASLTAVAGVGVGAELASGFALSSAGGVSAAIDSVQVLKNQSAAQEARAAFKASAPAPASPVSANQTKVQAVSRSPLTQTGLPSNSKSQSTPVATALPRADPRESSFGFGVPLRPTIGAAADQRASSIQGNIAVKPRVPVIAEPPSTTNPTIPGWIALPANDSGRGRSDKLQGKRRPKQPCGCSGRCGH